MSIKVEFFESLDARAWLTSEFLPKFQAIPEIVYRNDRRYLPKSPKEVEAELLRSQWLPRQRSFVVEGTARATARVAAEGDSRFGMLSHFEAINSNAESRALFEACVIWLQEQGCVKIYGPIDGDTWHRYRLSLGPFEREPYFLEPYNPPYYQSLWEQAGFEVLEEYSSKHVSDIATAKEPFAESYHFLVKDGYSLRPCNPSRFKDELLLLHQLTTEIFKDNFLYTDISGDEFLDLYSGLQRILKAKDLHFLMSPEAKHVGFLFALPDYQAAAQAKIKGGELLGSLLFLWKAKKAKTLNLKTLGVLPEHRKRGIAKALFYHAYCAALERGLSSANLCLMHKDNPSQKLDAGLGETFRKYALFQYA